MDVSQYKQLQHGKMSGATALAQAAILFGFAKPSMSVWLQLVRARDQLPHAERQLHLRLELLYQQPP
jgi:hypothetical protein